MDHPDLTITRVHATPLNLPVTMGGRITSLSICLVDVETSAGITGTGMTAITEEEVVASIVNDVAAHALVGRDPMRHEQLWDRLYWLLTPRGQSGYASHAIAAIDLALWDIKGQLLGEPCWRLLGGARDHVPVYATFGFAFFGRDELAAAAAEWVGRGFTRLKMTVGHHALQRRDEPRAVHDVIADDVARVGAVREAVGPGVQIFIDANCSLDYMSALSLARRLERYDIAFFEEPVSHNDVGNLVKLRGKVGMPLAGGQNEGLASRFRDFLTAQALDVVQRVLKPAGVSPERRTAELTVAILQLVASRRGLAALPRWAAQAQIERGYVLARPMGEAGLWSGLYAAFRSDDLELRRGFVEVLRRSAFQTLSGLAEAND